MSEEKTLEATVKAMQRELKKQGHEIERLQAVNEIQNLMGTYEYLHTANRHKEVMGLYAKKPKDVRVYWGEQGYWEGPDAPQKAWSILDKMAEGEGIIGNMPIHPITTPVIVVAGDGKTAKGVWIGTGFVAMSHKDEKTGKRVPAASWEWDKYGVDFIKEDGKWKFWHFHIYRIFRSGWNEPWEKQFEKGEPKFTFPEGGAPNGPAVDDNPYRPDTIQELKPVPPVPYEKWEDTFMY